MSSTVKGGSQTLDRGLAVLESVVSNDRPLTLSEVTEAVGLNRSVVYRLLRTLEDRALVTQASARGYEPGPGLLRLTHRPWSSLVTRARPLLDRLAVATGVTVVLTAAVRDQEVCLACALPPAAGPTITFREGATGPLGRGASSIALLALRPARPDERPEVASARQAEPLSLVRTAGELRQGAIGLAVAVRGPLDLALSGVFFDGGVDEHAVGGALLAAGEQLADAFNR